MSVDRGQWPRPLPDYLAAETAARVAYAALPWRERIVTAPPAGWRGGWAARVVSRVVAHRHRGQT